MSFIESLSYPLRVRHEHANGRNYLRLIDDRLSPIAYIHHVITPKIPTRTCLRQFIFNVSNRSYIATSVMCNGIEKINIIKHHPYIKTGENVHHFETIVGKPTKAKSTKKIRTKSPKIGNGEGIGQYSLDNAGIKVDRLREDYMKEKYALEYPPKKIVDRAKHAKNLE